MSSANLHVAILAAGQGKRMHSRIPKVLHPVGGIPMLARVVQTAEQLTPKQVHVVYGHGGQSIKKMLNLSVNWIQQDEQLGTGHAVEQVLPYLKDASQLLVLFGDTPLVPSALLKKLIMATPVDSLGIVTANFTNPFGLGRILRDEEGNVASIIEEKDASDEQRKITEIFTGIMLLPVAKLHFWLTRLTPHNAQKEYYLTDVLKMAVTEKVPVVTVTADEPEVVCGVNDRHQLMQRERYLQQKMAYDLTQQGVTIMDTTRLDIRGDVEIATDVTLDVNVILEGQVKIDEFSVIGANCVIRDSQIGKRVHVLPNTVIEEAIIGDDCTVGPFARIRPGAELANEVHIGNFVEIKKSKVGVGSKINHLSYVGDAIIGAKVNVGAGTITCNYDGVNKHQTIIEDGAFIGSDTQLVAPVTVGAGATIGAGSTITRNAPPETLTVSRAKQQTINGWQRPQKKIED